MKFIIGIVFIFVNISNASSLYTYSVDTFPAHELTCQQEADVFGARLNKSTGVTLYKSQCLKNNKTTFDFSVSYVADKGLPQENTYRPNGIEPQGIYRTLVECEANLNKDIRDFMQATGLDPELAYCFAEEGSGLQFPFSPKIVAFKKSITGIHPRTLSLLMGGAPAGDPKSFLSEFHKMLQSQKYHVTHVQLSTTITGEAQVLIYYYSEKPINIDVTSLGVYRNDTLCMSQANEIREVFTAAGILPLALFCNQPDFLNQHLQIITANPTHQFHLEITPDSYPSFEDCQKDRTRIFEFYQKELKRRVFGVICDGYARQYSAHVLERIPK